MTHPNSLRNHAQLLIEGSIIQAKILGSSGNTSATFRGFCSINLLSDYSTVSPFLLTKQTVEEP